MNANVVILLLFLAADVEAAGRFVVTFHEGNAENQYQDTFPLHIQSKLQVDKWYGRRIVLRPLPSSANDESILDDLISLKEIQHKNIQDVETDLECTQSQEGGVAGQWSMDPSEPYGMPGNWLSGYYSQRNSSNSTNINTTVAILDSGISSTVLPLFKNTLLGGYDFISSEELAMDGDGRDPDWLDNIHDEGGGYHGTKTATLLGIDPSKSSRWEFSGCIPEVHILPIRVLGRFSTGYASDIADSIVWAAGGEIQGLSNATESPRTRLIVMPFSSSFKAACPSYLQSAVNLAMSRNITIMASAGNRGSNTDASDFVPGSCNGVITVGALDRFGKITSYSASKAAMYMPGGDAANPLLCMTHGPALVPCTGTSFSVIHAAAAAVFAPQNAMTQVSSPFNGNDEVSVEGANNCYVGDCWTSCEYYNTNELGTYFWRNTKWWNEGGPEKCPANSCMWGTRPIPGMPTSDTESNTGRSKPWTDWRNYRIDELCACRPGYYADDIKWLGDQNGKLFYYNDDARPEGWCEGRRWPIGKDSFICKPCTYGSYCPGRLYYDAGSCNGYCNDAEGHICEYAFHKQPVACSDCGPGTYISNIEMHEGKPHDPCGFSGTLGTINKERVCKVCDTGKYSFYWNQLQCDNYRVTCSIDNYMSGKGATTYDIPCSSCTVCTPGQYTSKICEIGRAFVDAGNNGNRKCGPCQAAHYSIGNNQASCTPCANNEIAKDDRTGCKICGQDQWPDRVNNKCTNCPAGSFSSAGDSSCTTCNEAGKYWNRLETIISENDCENIYNDENYFYWLYNNYGLAYKPCDWFVHGGYMLLKGCFLCPKGKYQNLAGQTFCKDCLDPLMQDELGKASCKACPIYSRNRRIGTKKVSQISCQHCEQGKYWASDTVGTTVCTDCEAGKYQSITGGYSCTQCSAGTFNSQTAQINCIPCKAGKYCQNQSSAVQVDCPIGSISAVDGSTSCTLCVSNRFSPTAGGTSCQSCVPDLPIVLDTIAPFGHKSETIWQKHA
jgi:hypothetical protein